MLFLGSGGRDSVVDLFLFRWLFGRREEEEIDKLDVSFELDRFVFVIVLFRCDGHCYNSIVLRWSVFLLLVTDFPLSRINAFQSQKYSTDCNCVY